MKVFVSWSGERSQFIASKLRDWLPLLNFKIEPWMSDADIGAGRRWSDEIAKALEESSFGIICVTPENQHAPWLNFEAGAISKLRGLARVFTYLYSIRNSEVTGPLAAFQHVAADKDGTQAIVKAVNESMPAQAIVPERQLGIHLEKNWPDLEAALAAVPPPAGKATPKRDVRELIEEVLGIARELERRPHLEDSLSPSQLRSALGDIHDFVRIKRREESAKMISRAVRGRRYATPGGFDLGDASDDASHNQADLALVIKVAGPDDAVRQFKAKVATLLLPDANIQNDKNGILTITIPGGVPAYVRSQIDELGNDLSVRLDYRTLTS